MDIRYVVTSLATGSAEHIYDTLYCARGQAENLIKRHKSQLASDRTSCRSATANQMRLILHNAAYWLLRSEENTSELQSQMRISYDVFCLKRKKNEHNRAYTNRANDT